eukprot:2474722-Rhodomonas_salina.2
MCAASCAWRPRSWPPPPPPAPTRCVSTGHLIAHWRHTGSTHDAHTFPTAAASASRSWPSASRFPATVCSDATRACTPCPVPAFSARPDDR